eukprot:g704.t1
MGLKSYLVLVVAIFAFNAMLPSVRVQADVATSSSSDHVTVEDATIPVNDNFENEFEESKEDFEFQAEVSRLMDIIINSLYQNKEIYLRELISNASDALDKLRFLSLADPDVLGETTSLEMKVSFDEEARTLTITDTGIGMTKQDLIENLGTVAKSGTTQFVEAIQNTGDLSLIGQFGVGFYSVYLVADKVRVTSKHNDDVQHVWESTADNTFSVAEDPRGNTLGRGTEITLFLKDDASEFLDQSRLETLIKRYSEFVTFPIFLRKWSMEEQEIEFDDDEEDIDIDDDEEDLLVEDDDDVDVDDDEEEAPRTERVKVWNWSLINNQKAIWVRNKNDVSEEEYNEFYKALSKDYRDPLTYTHFKAEGEIEFRSILFVPGSAPHDMYDQYYARSSSIRLYVRKVLITDEFDEFLPRYLSFVRGVVDSDDLPLNVSRETLQQHKVLKVMGKKLTRKVLEMLRKLSLKAKKEKEEKENEESEDSSSEEEEKKEVEDPYIKFWEEFGKSIKLGLIEDSSNRSKLAKLLRFKTSASEDNWTSLSDYVERMPDWQQSIYYISGSSEDEVKSSPMIEILKKKGLEVVYLTDPLDEISLQNLTEFEGFKLQSVTKEGLKFGDEDEYTTSKRLEMYEEKFEPLTSWMKDLYGKKVSKITFSNRLDTTPCVLVTGQYGYSAHMEKVMRSQAFADDKKSSMQYMMSQRTLELNPRHPIFTKMMDLVQDESGDDEVAKDLALVLLDTAMLTSGFNIDNTADFAKRMYGLMKQGLNLESDELLPEIEVPPEPEDEDLDEDEVDDLDDLEDDGRAEL